MKSRLIQTATLAGVIGSLTLAATAHAQTNITTYGIIDAAYEYYSNSDASGSHTVRMPSLGGGMFPSRLGIRGSEDLGDGLKAIFTLENGFATDTGANAQNRLFGRQAFVGLANKWGQVTLGRNYNMIYVSTFDVDIFGPSQYGLGALDSAIPNGRSDNSIAYRGTFNSVTIGGTYSIGRDTSAAGGSSGTNCPGEDGTGGNECHEWSALLRYDGANWALVSAYDRMHGGPSASNNLTTEKTDSRMHVGGYMKFDRWRVGGGVVARDNQGSSTQPRSRLYYVGAAYNPVPAVTIDGQLAKLDYLSSVNDSNQILLRAIYAFSKQTQVYVAAGHISTHGTAAVALSAGGSVGAGMGQTGLITGIKMSF